jgi:hypothetical protein
MMVVVEKLRGLRILLHILTMTLVHLIYIHGFQGIDLLLVALY